MSTRDNLIEWLNQMGLLNVDPKKLTSICNPSTAVIWEQLIQNATSKQKVESITRNIVVHRFQKNSLDKQDEFPYGVQCIDIYARKVELVKRVAVLERVVQEISNKNKDIQCKNRKRYIAISSIRENVRELKEKTHLLCRKIKAIQEDLTYVESLIAFLQNKSSSDEATDESIEKCVGKLQEIIVKVKEPEKVASLNRSLMRSSTSFVCNTPTSGLKNKSTLKYFSKSGTQLDFSENRRKLYSDEKLDKDIIPEEDFLNLSYTFEDVFLSEESFVSKNHQKSASYATFGSFTRHATAKDHFNLLEKITKNSYVAETCQNLLNTKSKSDIISGCYQTREKIIANLHEINRKFPRHLSSSTEADEETLCELYYTHSKYELEALALKSRAKQLQDSIKTLQNSDQYSLAQLNSNTKLILENIRLDAALDFVTKYTKCTNNLKTSIDLRAIQLNINQASTEINQKTNNIEEFINNIHLLMSSIQDKRREAIGRLNRIIYQDSFIRPFTDEVFTKEIQLMEHYPLAFNHDFRNGNLSLLTFFPSYVEWNTNNINRTVHLLRMPFSPIEHVLASFIKANVKRVKFGLWKGYKPDFPAITIPVEEVEASNGLLDKICLDLSDVMDSPVATSTLASCKKMQEITDLWLNMTFGDYVSRDRLSGGHDYQHFKKRYDRLLHDLDS